MFLFAGFTSTCVFISCIEHVWFDGSDNSGEFPTGVRIWNGDNGKLVAHHISPEDEISSTKISSVESPENTHAKATQMEGVNGKSQDILENVKRDFLPKEQADAGKSDLASGSKIKKIRMHLGNARYISTWILTIFCRMIKNSLRFFQPRYFF